MNSTLTDTFVYCHKKFHHNKRLRSDSFSSSTGDYESTSIKLEIESIYESSYQQTKLEKSAALSFAAVESDRKRSFASYNKEGSILLSRTKRPRLSSFSSTIHLNTSTTVAAVVPPAVAILPKISDETLRSICKYHGNMVRKFPKKERTPKDQERRNKNTIACRMSRRVKKLEHIAVEEQYKEFSEQTFDIVEKSMRATAYLHELIKLASCAASGEIKAQSLKTEVSASVHQKKPFTIAYLTGTA